MKKKILKYSLLFIFIVIVLCAVFNIYKWIVSGEQYIKISTTTQAYTNSDLYVSVVAQKNNVDLETKTKLKLLDSKGKKVKGAQVSYDGNIAVIKVPDVEPGNYKIEAKVSSKAGKDTVKQSVYISTGNSENATITLDKGIYKPGDTVKFRALITSKENDVPIKEDVNVCIYDGNDNKVYNENVTSSDYGIISGNFKLADEVNSGIYKLVVKTKSNETTKQFKVNPYVTPKYEVKITKDKQNYLIGEIAKINIEANYFFGEPVSKAKYVVYINNEKYEEVTANEQGVASIEYEIKDAKNYNIKVEAVDTSSYFVEATDSFVAGTDKFEIELLPEYGTLVAGEKNTVYVYTKTADGTPLKTYLTINSGKFSKQVATDENGIGRFSIDVDQIENNNNYNYYYDYNYSYQYSNVPQGTQTFSVTATDVNGNQVRKNISLEAKTKNLILSTDKVKYNQGEDIKITVSSLKNNNHNIYFFKNKKLIKMVTTDMTETTVNLDDTYGLIDIYITEKDSNYRYWYKPDTYKKTIFVKPSKALNIEIGTDKEEYKPGENITISIGTTDENKNSVESALLVSMLDNSILNLAKNDLSIDNIKLALQDIEFSDELDAATVYASIMDDSESSTLTALLLKQKDTDENIYEIIINNLDEEELAMGISILLIIVIVLMIIGYLLVKFKKFRGVMKHVLNIIIYVLLLITIVSLVIEEYLWDELDFNIWTVIVTTIFGITTYILWISKLNKKIFRTSVSITISVLAFLGIVLLYEVWDIPVGIVLIVLAVLVLICSILSKIKKFKTKKYINKLSAEAIYILKLACAMIVAWIVGRILERITDIYEISVPVMVVVTYFTNYWLNIRNKYKEQIEGKEAKPIKEYITPVLATIGAIAIGYIVLRALGNTGYRGRYYYEPDVIDYSYDALMPNSDTSLIPNSAYNSKDLQGSSSKGISSLFENAENFLSMGASDVTGQDKSVAEGVGEETVNVEQTDKNESNIRNVFLESMCFIPEVIAGNGNAQINLKLSDNITTWTIQTVGNTKDGKVGYGILDTVKVFKDFFVDFELPANLVEQDKISVPVTVYNYTEGTTNTTLKIKADSWFKTNNSEINVRVGANSSKMVCVPIEILEKGSHKLRIEAVCNSMTDIIEKEVTVTPNGYKVEKVVSSGVLDEDIEEDILILEDIIENSASAKVKIYASNMSQTIEGMENIFRMPTGCFEQISSSLYPNILALKYMEDNNIVNDKLKEKALNYISSGYQKLLTYEVQSERGGFSLYGDSPAETVLTAYGLMELSDLSKVYNVDDNVTKRMTDFLYKKQNSNGSFTITGYHVGGAGSREDLALNAYITWALSETDAKNPKLTKSVEYLKEKLDKVDDNYTLALIANVLANVKDKEVNQVIKRLVNNVNIDGNRAYINSKVSDYYGCSYNYQTLQTVALTSMALSKTSSNNSVNKQLINYIIGQKDAYGTWYSTQGTILALKALNEFNEKGKLENQTIKVSVNSDTQEIGIKDNPLEIYQLLFKNLGKENKLKIDIEKGNAFYEVVEEYYIPYNKVNTEDNNIEITVEANQNLKVNGILSANIKLVNKNEETIRNGMVTISIPAGCQVVEESLALLEAKGIIEKYEMTYRAVNLYLRDFEVSQLINLTVNFRARYPVEITGFAIRAYDYYNPSIEGGFMPIKINVTD